MTLPIVISASRRTDIPAFYMDWFMSQIREGRFAVKNPFNGAVSLVPAIPEAVHTIVFWSKDFGRFLSGGYGATLTDAGYHLFFNFTVNSSSSILEPHIAPLEDRLEQARELCRRFGPETVQWRFDPICFYQKGDATGNNLTDFPGIAEQMAACGVRRCITSFADIYAKVKRRTSNTPEFTFIDPSIEKKIRVLEKMAARLETLDMNLYTCCEKEVTDALPASSSITPSVCIPNRCLVDIFGGRLSFAKDAGQRKSKGCGCLASKDIGAYDAHPCYHDCLYCYANQAAVK